MPVDQPFDLLVAGGGINGAGIARDAAGRGLRVLLVERDDLASHTSSASTKLIHGGLRYLEYAEFRLVREALVERERLLGIAPHLIRPLRFVLPQTHSPRPAWMVRAGLWLYDHLAARGRLPGTETLRLDRDPRGQGLRADARGTAFAYSDCRVDDSRLVVLTALDAAERGADIRPRTELMAARRESGHWLATIRDAEGERSVRARALVNAAGPWVAELLGRIAGASSERGVRLVKGSHIVVPRLYEGEHAFLLQNPDRRVVFAIPYEQRFTLVGTTDEPWHGPPGAPRIDAAELAYLLDTIARYFETPVVAGDVAWSYSGIRPLYDDHAADASAVTRDYVLDLDGRAGAAPLLSVFGGKITTYRRLAEHALEMLASALGIARGAWTADAPLPGGEIAGGDVRRYAEQLHAAYPGLPAALLDRLAAAYGTRAERLLGEARTLADLGEDFGDGLTARELDHLAAHEWARTAEDVLWRRTRLGLHLPAEAAVAIDAYLHERK